ncbi:hypothetical protein [Chitinophaga barathri]|uniref:Carboxypeptidase regulatory-like domain-containing protein n=1 Tax=Chitinophaga barathri TaxID=1647451 RepID=A0A3N4MEH8_9BACT|nr:hypothetical protein [Chitinophaga barathri]RPD41755.1 hypothetical protein EG028_06190 [Chitinophaga barathri]
MTRFLLSLSAILLIGISCRKEKLIPGHVTSTVDGIVRHTVTGEPLQGVTVRIYGCRGPRGFMPLATVGEKCHPMEDFAITDVNGYFNIRFNADGESEYFSAQVDPESPMSYEGTSEILNTGRYSNVALNAKNTKVLKLHVSIQQNPFDTLFISGGWRSNGFNVYKRQVDTTVYCRYTDAEAYIHLSVFDRSVGRSRTFRETFRAPQPAADTVEHEVLAENTRDWPTN